MGRMVERLGPGVKARDPAQITAPEAIRRVDPKRRAAETRL